jgi:Zn-dependent protease with chaperone function
MIILHSLHSIAELAGQRMINGVLEGAITTLLAYFVIRLMPRSNSGTRFIIWFASLLAIAALSLLGGSETSSWAARVAPRLTLPGSWALYGFAAWLAMAALGLGRVAIGLWHLLSLRRSCRELEASELNPLWRNTLNEFDHVRRAKLCLSDSVRVPTAIGFVRPIVAIPSWALYELSAVELNSVLLHELGHLRRWDDWTNLAQRFLAALLFFHPAVWWIDSRLTLEREMACDDLVLAETSDARGYAQCLVSVAEKSLLRTGTALALAAVSRVRHMALRLSRILDQSRRGGTSVSRPALAMMTAVSAGALLIAPQVPTVVAFQESQPAGHVAGIATSVPISPLKVGSRVQTQIVQAVAHEVCATPVNAVVQAVSDRAVKPQHRKDLMRSRAQILASGPPRLIRAKANVDQPSGPTLLFVVQTQDYDGDGTPVWTLCVWRVTFVPDPGQTQVRSQVVSKSI